jgi:hypothetical protein
MRKRLVGSELNACKKVVVVLHCVLQDDVLCIFRKSEQSGIMDRCFKCEQYVRFNREMDEEDERIMADVDRMFAHPENVTVDDFDVRDC